jgi:hypothetical protein
VSFIWGRKMPKVYFIVSSLCTGKNVTVSLFELYKSNNKVCSEERLGGAPGINQYGLRTSDHVLTGIGELIELADTDAMVFNGYRVAEHIEAIFAKYKDQATFIFTRDRQPGVIANELRSFSKYATDEFLQQVIADQKAKISKVITDNNLNVTYRPVNWNNDMFDGGVINSEEGPIEIAIYGTLV